MYFKKFYLSLSILLFSGLIGCFPFKSSIEEINSIDEINSISKELLTGNAKNQKSRAILTGYIFYKNQKPFYGATIQLLDGSVGAISDDTGYFQIINIPDGIDTLKVSAVGHNTYYFTIRISIDFLYLIDTIFLEEQISSLPSVI